MELSFNVFLMVWTKVVAFRVSHESWRAIFILWIRTRFKMMFLLSIQNYCLTKVLNKFWTTFEWAIRNQLMSQWRKLGYILFIALNQNSTLNMWIVHELLTFAHRIAKHWEFRYLLNALRNRHINDAYLLLRINKDAKIEYHMKLHFLV
jgi:hypothetical protein